MTSCTNEETKELGQGHKLEYNVGMWASFSPCLPRSLRSAGMYLKPGQGWVLSIRKALSKRSGAGPALVLFSFYSVAVCISFIKTVIRRNFLEEDWIRRVGAEWAGLGREEASILPHLGPTHADLDVGISGWLGPSLWVQSAFFRESRKLCFAVYRNLKATTIYSTPARKNPKASKEPQTLCFNHLQVPDKPHLLAGISLSKYLEEMSWNGGHAAIALAICKTRGGARPDQGKEVAKLPASPLELLLSLCVYRAGSRHLGGPWEGKDALQFLVFAVTENN